MAYVVEVQLVGCADPFHDRWELAALSLAYAARLSSDLIRYVRVVLREALVQLRNRFARWCDEMLVSYVQSRVRQSDLSSSFAERY